MKQKNNNKLTNKKRTQCEIRNNKVRCFGQVLLKLLISSRRLRIWTLTLPAMIVNNRLIAIFKLANYFIRIFRITLCLVGPSVNFFFVKLLKQFFLRIFTIKVNVILLYILPLSTRLIDHYPRILYILLVHFSVQGRHL